jgi:hypothetical protein
MKLLYLFNQRQHFKNRLRLRKGSSICFLFSKVIDKKQVCDSRKDECLVWKFRNHIYITQNNQLQTYIKK